METAQGPSGETTRSIRVRYRGQYYDISKFAPRHPGGHHLLEALSDGVDVEEFMKGHQEGIDGKRHEHSSSAYTILEKYAIDKQQTSGKDADGIDWSQPIFFQVGNLRERYWSWVHEPIDFNMRLLKSDICEYFSRNNWYAVPLTWMPLVAVLMFVDYGLMSAYFEQPGARLLFMSILFLTGVFLWTLMEYILHRYLFHWQPNPQSYFQITAHFLLHGIHHKSPMDPDRLVFPPVLAAVGVIFFFFIYRTLLPWPIMLAVGAGKLAGYVAYDVTHYYLHHGSPPAGSYADKRKAYHHAHHYKEPDLGW